MSGKTAILAVRIISDSTSAARDFDKTGTAAERMGKRMQTASRVAKIGLVGIAGASVAAARAAAEDQKSQVLLAQTMQKNAGASARQVAATEKWIAATSRASGVADDQLRPALGAIVRATGDVATGQRALKTAMDVSAQTGKPLATVSAAIAKAYGGQTGALSRLVPGLDQATLKSGNMAKIMQLLADKTGGAAAAAANTATGRYQRMLNTFHELQESLGSILLPALSQLSTVLGKVATFAQEHTKAFQVLAATLTITGAGVIAVNAAYKVFTATTLAVRAAVIVARNAQLAFNLALMANPIGLIVAAVVLLIAGLVLAYKKSATFRAIVQAVGKAGVSAFKTVWGWIKKAVDKVKELIDWVKNINWPSAPKWVSKLFGKGGAPGVYVGAGGTPGYARSSLPGRGGPGDGGFLASMGGSRGATFVTINITGAIDTAGTARQIKQILRRADAQLGGSW